MHAQLRAELAEPGGRLAAAGGDATEWCELIEMMPQIVWIARPDGWRTNFNPKWVEFTGLSLEQSLGFGWNLPFHPEDRERAARHWEQATCSGEPYDIEYRLQRADGSYHWMLGRAVPLHDRQGRIVKWFGTCTDIDEFKRSQDELEASRYLHRLAGQVARIGGWIYRTDDRTMSWSDELYDVFELSRDVAPDLDDTIALAVPHHQQPFRAVFAACVAEGESFDVESEGRTFRGRHRWVRVIAEPRRDEHGIVTGVQGAVQDITASKEVKRRSQVLADRLTTTLESITDAFFTVDETWTLTYVNRRAEQLLELGRCELLGTNLWDAFPQAIHTVLYDRYHLAMTSGASDVIEEFYWPPISRWLDIHVYPSEHGLAVYIRDVTDIREVRHCLHERVKELQALAAVNAGANRIAEVEALCQLAADNLVAGMQQPDMTSVVVELEGVIRSSGAVQGAATASRRRSRSTINDAGWSPSTAGSRPIRNSTIWSTRSRRRLDCGAAATAPPLGSPGSTAGSTRPTTGSPMPCNSKTTCCRWPATSFVPR